MSFRGWQGLPKNLFSVFFMQRLIMAASDRHGRRLDTARQPGMSSRSSSFRSCISSAVRGSTVPIEPDPDLEPELLQLPEPPPELPEPPPELPEPPCNSYLTSRL